MQVILKHDVDELGEKGEVLNVSDGYARNYLFPQKLAVEATPGAMKDLNLRISRIRAAAQKKHEADLAKADKISGLGVITLEANVGEGGKLFGAVTTKELAKVLFDKTGLEIDRKNLSLNQPIHKVGDYTLTAKLSPKVTTSVGIEVIPMALM
jgi:large subunit ribosomal protein L9